MKRITIQILTKNNEKNLKEAIESVLPLNPEILIGDFNSNDRTLNICKFYGCKILNCDIKNRSQIRNDLVQKSTTDWQFHLEPWEVLSYGLEEIQNKIQDNKLESFYFQIFRNDTITKEIRLWNKKKNLIFYNPVYECLIDEKASLLNGAIFSKFTKSEEIWKLIQDWKKRMPAASEPYYYEACSLLADNKNDEFLRAAELYLFRDNIKVLPVTMMRYYCAMVYCHIKNDAITAVRYILPCIAAQPLMAEFWCLLGDIHYKLLKDYEKAYAFYDNAIKLGAKRTIDQWPMEIKKYDEYPSEVKKSCVSKIKKTMFLGKV